ncbi:MAG: hypothetical protein ACI9UK_001056 [Candidatus Krumholzibacteriia bacterium]|jgi:hypothetical protein
MMIISAMTCAWAQADGLTESPDGEEAVTVYFTPDQALAKVFAEADSMATDHRELNTDEVVALELALGWHLAETSFDVHRAWDQGKDLGYAVITAEQGRFKPITFLVQVKPDFSVEMVLVMVYRESRGDGVKRQRFLKQFRKKDSADHLRLNRDIVAVSGATMSSRGITAGVKKVLNLVEMLYGESGMK